MAAPLSPSLPAFEAFSRPLRGWSTKPIVQGNPSPRLHMISVILPTFNEISSGYLGPIVSRLARLPQAEILVIDGGSADGTVEFVAGHGMEVLSLPG
ncbi:MAG: glycosyltransferase, partial [Pseudohongiellaceae bacterium]